MIKIKLFIASLFMLGGLAFLTPAPEAAAINVFDRSCNKDSTSELCSGRAETADSMVEPIVSTLLFVVGVVAVVVIIIGGILYVTSTGDPGKTKRAKDTILYAVIGLVVAIMAYAIVAFVVSRL
jgi:hypothetical protein